MIAREMRTRILAFGLGTRGGRNRRGCRASFAIILVLHRGLWLQLRHGYLAQVDAEAVRRGVLRLGRIFVVEIDSTRSFGLDGVVYDVLV